MANFIYFRTMLTNQNYMPEEMKNGINSGNAYSVQNLFSSRLITKNIKIKVCRTVFYLCCEMWSFTLKEEHRLRGLENRSLRKIFFWKRVELKGS
jgi:hypothetical protein